ncbi:MAG: 50S ribosomal protein L31 [Anaerolineae bacterium]|nr:50S ribosomal protein L31 [Anaerolineae bacterium]MDW8070216.1 50S ribosomal protein L31 [Anaerolineae bacterium]
MKEGIHPKYYPNARVVCSCGATWTTGSTVELIRTDVCSNCHPFFTGEQRIIDTAGQVDRYHKRVKQRDLHEAEEKARLELALRKRREALLRQQIEALDLGDRVHRLLVDAGMVTIGDLLKKMEEGEAALQSIEGLSARSIREIKERLQMLGLTSE